MAVQSSRRQDQVAAENAIRAIGCGYDITYDLRLSYCKEIGCLIEVEREAKRDVVIPGGVMVADVPEAIRCDRGESVRFSSDVLLFQEMAQLVNHELNIEGRIPSGIFNAMFEFTGSWQKDAAGTQHLAYDGWFITLYSVALTKSQIVLQDAVKQEVPTEWNPLALARFIVKYGTHVITGVNMGGKDVIYVKQQHPSNLKREVQKLLKTIAAERFSDANGHFSLLSKQTSQKDKVADSLVNINHLRFVDSNVSTSVSVKEDIIKMYKRIGGLESAQSHHQWTTTIPSYPDVISMSFVPIISLLNGVSGTGFLGHAINLYLRYKPPIEELHQFLEFQLPRQWAPVFSELPLVPRRTEDRNTLLQFSLMGQNLYVNTSRVSVGRKPVTGVRLFLEGKKCNRLAIHLQHLSATPNFFELSDLDYDYAEPEEPNHEYYEPVQWKIFSRVCTAPIECNGSLVGDPASVVTGARLEVRLKKIQKILFLKLQFSRVDGASIRKSEWYYSPNLSEKSGIVSMVSMSSFLKKRPKPIPCLLDSAIHPSGPPVSAQVSKLSKLVDTTELTKGPQDIPGHWVVTGAKLCVEGGKISLGVKFSLLELNDIL